MTDDARRPERFQRRPRGQYPEIGFEITGGFLTVSGEQRRRICQDAIGQGLVKISRPDITVDGDIEYVRDVSRGFVDSIVRVNLNVPVDIHASGKVSHRITVPPFQDWSESVIRTVIGFIVAWASRLT